MRTRFYNNYLWMILPTILFEVLTLSSCIQNSKTASDIEKKQLLEVKTQASETSYPNGNILDIRVYNNRAVEFDFYLPNTPDRVGMPFSSETKSSTLNEEDFNEIKSLLTNSDLLNADGYYAPGKQSSVDSNVKKTITVSIENKEKTITLEERDSHLHLNERTNIYPSSVIKLLILVDDINLRLRKQIDSKSR